MIAENIKIPMSDSINISALLSENNSKNWLVVTHGLGEHKGRHSYMLDLYSQYFNVVVYDLRGHGESDGERGTITNFAQYMRDLSDILSFLAKEYKMQNYTLFGHSMGGLIVSSFMQSFVKENFYPDRVFLSAPALAPAAPLSYVFPSLPITVLQTLDKMKGGLALGGILDIQKLSHNYQVYLDYKNDPLNILKINTKLFVGLLLTAKQVLSRPMDLNCPLSVAIAGDDTLVGSSCAISYFQQQKNCEMQVIEGAYHEMHNEVKKYKNPYMAFLRKSLIGDN